MIARLERDAVARARRRAQALEALEFERERERALHEQFELVVLDEDGPRVDEEAFARMDAADVAIVREVLGESSWDDDEEPDGLEEPEEAELDDDELARLAEEIEASRRVQAALERFVAALDEAAE
jgi:hypothetical protein